MQMDSTERQLIFVDGSNFLVQLSKELRLSFRAEKPPTMALQMATTLLSRYRQSRPANVIRRYWFASYKGNDEYLLEYRKELRARGFDPRLFRKRDGREKKGSI